MHTDVVVVGAGLTGLTTAFWLRIWNVKVHVVVTTCGAYALNDLLPSCEGHHHRTHAGRPAKGNRQAEINQFAIIKNNEKKTYPFTCNIDDGLANDGRRHRR